MNHLLYQSRLKGIVLVLILLASLYVNAGAAGHRGSQDQVPMQTATPKVYPDRTTPIWISMTSGERLRSKLFNKYGSLKRIIDRGISVMTISDRPEPPGGDSSDSPALSRVIADLACRADAVFSGVPMSRKSMPIEDGTFLFSDYQVKIDRVVRSDRRLMPGQVVVVTRPGGEIQGDGFVARAKTTTFPMLTIGQPFLFMVENIDGDTAFQTPDAHGLFSLLRGQAKALNDLPTRETNLATVGIPITALFERLDRVDCTNRGGSNGR